MLIPDIHLIFDLIFELFRFNFHIGTPSQRRILRRAAAPRCRDVLGCAMRETYDPVVCASETRPAHEVLEARVEAVELVERAAEARPQLPVLVQQADQPRGAEARH